MFTRLKENSLVNKCNIVVLFCMDLSADTCYVRQYLSLLFSSKDVLTDLFNNISNGTT